MAYIELDQLIDNLWVSGNFTDAQKTSYITLADNKINDIAEEKGIEVDDIETSPVSYTIQEYCVYYATMRMCLDFMGTNNNDLPVEIEKYAVKYNLYHELVKGLEPKLTQYVFTGIGDVPEERAQASRLYRG
jgi:hypothetical protein